MCLKVIVPPGSANAGLGLQNVTIVQYAENVEKLDKLDDYIESFG